MKHVENSIERAHQFLTSTKQFLGIPRMYVQKRIFKTSIKFRKAFDFRNLKAEFVVI